MRIRLCLALASLAAFAASPARADVQINVDKSAQTLTVSRDGQVLHTWPVSTGRAGRFTPSGSYQAFRMEKDHYSREFDDAPMPYSVFFTKRGHAIHGSYDTGKLGRPASGGCVRLAPENAKVLFDLVKAEGVLKTQVSISGDERIALARPQKPVQASARHAEREALPQRVEPNRQRYAAPREAYAPAPQYNYRQPQQQQQPYFYDGYRWRPYQGEAEAYRPQPNYGGGYGQQDNYYRPRYYYD